MVVGDYVVLFHRDYKYVEFNSYGRVAEVIRERNQDEFYEDAEEDEGEEQGEGYSTVVRLVETVVIKNPLTLDDLAYSILKIYRYTKPYLHFRRSYIALPPEDFETIINGFIFWSRTAFGMFINELRTEQRELFIQELANSAPDVALQNSDFVSAWEALRHFIEAEYISAAQLMHEIHLNVNLLHEEHGLRIDYTKLGISPNNALGSDLISVQEDRLSKFLSATSIEKGDVFQELQKNIEESQSESRFQKIFRGEPWPL